jgi:hypothetical protein
MEMDVRQQIDNARIVEASGNSKIEAARGEWVRPALKRLSVGSAEQGFGGIGADSTGSAS